MDRQRHREESVHACLPRPRTISTNDLESKWTTSYRTVSECNEDLIDDVNWLWWHHPSQASLENPCMDCNVFERLLQMLPIALMRTSATQLRLNVCARKERDNASMLSEKTLLGIYANTSSLLLSRNLVILHIVPTEQGY